jgi:hypothetical protein
MRFPCKAKTLRPLWLDVYVNMSKIFPCGDSKLHAPDGLSQTDRCSLMGTTGTDREASLIGLTFKS